MLDRAPKRPPKVVHKVSLPGSSSLKSSNRSFCYASPHLWNQFRVSFNQPCMDHSADVTLSNSPPTCSPLSPSITHSLFHSRLKTHLFHKSIPPTLSAFSDYTGQDSLCSMVFHFQLFFFLFIVGHAVDYAGLTVSCREHVNIGSSCHTSLTAQ